MAIMEGRCVSCGFLGKQDDNPTASHRYPGTFEIEPSGRASPELAFMGIHSQANVSMGTMRPVCYRQVVPVADEIAAQTATTGGVRADAAGAVFNRDRHCPEWCEYVPGFDPKEHLMERRLSGLEGDRRAFQAALSKSGRGFIYLGLILAAAQVLTMTPESVIYRVGAILLAHLGRH